MRNHRLIVCSAAAAVFAMYSTSFASRQIKITDPSYLAPDQASQASGMPGSSVLPQANAAIWIGPSLDSSANPPTDPREGYWNIGANWSTGIVPNGATDTATFNDNGDLFGYRAWLTGDITLAAFNDNTQSGTSIASDPIANVTRTITTGTGGLQLNANVLTFERSLAKTRYFTLGTPIDASITGSGPLIKNGPGDTWLARNSSYTGGTIINDGRLVIAGGYAPAPNRPDDDFGDSVLGDANATLTFNGGGLFIRQDATPPVSYSFNRPIQLNGNAFIEFNGDASPDFNGVISGSGNLRLSDGGDSHFLVPMTYTGETIIDNYDFHLLIQDGAMANSSAVRNFGRLDIDNSFSGGNVDRVGDNAPVYLYGNEIVLTGGSGFDTTENVGTIVMRTGMNELTIVPSAGNLTTLGALAIDRQNRSTLVIRGQNLGAGTVGATRGHILLTQAPTLVGGLVPWAYGSGPDVASASTAVGVGTGVPVTYDTDGLRPLRPSEMTSSLAAGGNVFLTASDSGSGTINSLTLSNSTGTEAGGTITVGAGNLNVTSGVIIDNIGAGPVNTTGSRIDANINFGSAEGVIHAITNGGQGNNAAGSAPVGARGLTINGIISGSNGLTKGGQGDLILTGTNTYTGPTTVTEGRIVLRSDVTAGAPGPLGADSSPITLAISGNGGSAEWQGDASGFVVTGLANDASGTLTIARDIRVVGQSQSVMAGMIGGTSINSITKITGNVDIGSTTPADVSGNNVTLTASGGTVQFDGVISGPGRLQVDGATRLVLNNANTYTGGTEFGVFNWVSGGSGTRFIFIGNDAAFGTGTVDLDINYAIQSNNGNHTIANDFMLFSGVNVRGDNTTGQLTFSGTWDLDVTFSQQAFNIGVGTQSTTVATWTGTIENGGITKLGSGTMVLAGANQFSGPVSVGNPGSATQTIANGGVLVARHPQALSYGGSGSNFSRVVDGSTLVLDGANGDIVAPNEEVVANGDGFTFGGTTTSFGAIRNASGNNQLGNLDLIGYLNGAGTVATAANVNINVAGGALTMGDVLDLSGPTIPATGNDPNLRGPGNGIITKTGPGMLTVGRIFNTETSAGTIGIDGGTLNSAVESLTKKAIGGLVVNDGTLRIAAGATANQPDRLAVTTSLSVTAPGKLDLTNNSMVIDYTGPVGTLVGDTRTMLQDGRLTSSSADSTHRLGYGDNAVLNKASFAGISPDTSSLLVKFTYGGDANLDGQVDVTDLGALATNWQTSNVWTGGDFNYDGFVDVTDLGILATDWQLGVGSPLGPGSFQAALTSLGLGGVSVPEPVSLGIMSLALMLVGRRRRSL